MNMLCCSKVGLPQVGKNELRVRNDVKLVFLVSCCIEYEFYVHDDVCCELLVGSFSP